MIIITNNAKVYLDDGKSFYVGRGTGSTNNSITIFGSQLISGGGTMNIGAISSNNILRVTDNGYLNMDESGSLLVAYANNSYQNGLIAENSSVITNNGSFNNLSIGGKPGANENFIIITNDASFYANVIQIGVGCLGGNQSANQGGNNNCFYFEKGIINTSGDSFIGYTSASNILILGSQAIWHAGNDSYDHIFIGSADGYGNILRVNKGSLIDNVSEINIGQDNGQKNRLELNGGNITSETVHVYSDNIISPQISTTGTATPLTVTGTATFESGSVISPNFETVSIPGTYTVVTASEIIDNGLMLDPQAASGWTLITDSTSVKLNYSILGSVILIQ